MDRESLTLGEVLARDAAAFPDREAVVTEDERLTYAELNERANRFAAGLVKLGVAKGDKVGLWMPNYVEWVVAWFGISKVGAVVIPLDTWYKIPEAEYILGHSDSVACVISEKFGSVNYARIMKGLRPSLPQLKHVIVSGNPAEGQMTMDSVIELGGNWRDDENYLRRLKQPEADDLAFILYTSGTTGKPKGAMLTHRNIVRNAKDCGDVMKATYKDVLLIPVPFSHCFGNVLGITMSAVFGITMVPMVAFDPEKALQVVEKEKCTMIHGVPTMFIRELDVLKRKHYDISSLRTGIIAGAPCPIDTMEGIINDMGCNVVILYGLTEVSPGATMTRLTDDVQHRCETVGQALPGVDVRVVDDDRKEVPLGEVGEIAIRGYNVMQGYYKMPDESSRTIDGEGWLYSGDLGTEDADGYFRITGRKKDMIIVGGANVYPREIEEYLITHPKIREVSVVGVPDHDLGEVVGTAIIQETGSGLTAQEVCDFCYGKIASNKVPRFVMISDVLPISGRGKVQKFILRKEMADKIERHDPTVQKVVPTEVLNKSRMKDIAPKAEALIRKGLVESGKKLALVKFLLGLPEEQLKEFEGLF